MQTCHIVKIGGKLIDDKAYYDQLIQAFAQLSGPKILVHGGGKRGSEVLKKMNIPVRYNEGRRITDKKTMEVVTMVYAGSINTQIVADLQAKKCKSIGLSGCDLDIIKAEKRKVKDIDYGYAGDIVSINAQNLLMLLDNGIVPVLSPITHNGLGQLLNTNADTIAATVAAALAPFFSVSLHYCFEYNGVMKDLEDPTSLIEQISYLDFLRYQKAGVIEEGMIPKMTNAFEALRKNVNNVSIGSPSHFISSIPYTTLKMA